MSPQKELTPEQIKDYKQKLSEDRSRIVRSLMSPAVRNIWLSVVEKYSDSAHFLYEILQNADDAGATESKFILNDNELIFIHNGTRYFSISNVETEEIDQKNGSLGDLNAITSIGQSSKKGFEDSNAPKIGKFGMGFKSVFQYTSSPVVYDQNFKFRLTDYIVPNWLKNDYRNRKKYETVFVFPFDREDMSPENAKREIFIKLQNLVMPILFLHSMEKIEYECGNIKGVYLKNCLEDITFGNTSAKKYEVINGSENDKTFLWLFSREDEEKHSYSVGYFIDENGKLVPKPNYSAFCFFPTKVKTHLNFIIHAPFLLTDSREGIKANSVHNRQMIQKLALLAADALEYFVEIGNKQNTRIIDDNIIKIIPIQKDTFKEVSTDSVSFEEFYFAIQEKFMNGLLPTKDGYISADKACWADVLWLPDLFNKERLQICKKTKDYNYSRYEYETKLTYSNCDWIFSTIAGKRNNPELDVYLREMGVRYIEPNNLISNIDSSFIEHQSVEWLCSLYEKILRNNETILSSKSEPIFLNKDNKACAAFVNNEPQLFLSSDNSEGYNVVKPELEKNEIANQLLKRLGVSIPVLKDKIFNKILKKNDISGITDFKDILDYYIECSKKNDSNKSMLIKTLKYKKFLKAFHSSRQPHGNNVAPNEGIYLYDDNLVTYFTNNDEALFVDEEQYKCHLALDEQNYLRQFFKELGCAEFALHKKKQSDESTFEKAYGSHIRTTKPATYVEYYLDGAKEFLDVVTEKKDVFYSKILMNQMIAGCSGSYYFRSLFYLSCDYFYRYRLTKQVKSSDADLFIKKNWLLDNTGNWVSPEETYLQHLSNNYNISDPDIKKFLTEYLGIQKEHPEYDNLPAEIKPIVELQNLLEKNGLKNITQEEIELIKKSRQKNVEPTSPTPNEEKSNTPSNRTGATTENKVKETSSEKDSPEDSLIKEIGNKAKTKGKEPIILEPQSGENDDDDEGGDDFTPPSIDYQKKIEKTKDKCAVQINLLKEYEDAQKIAQGAAPYSYQWFSALLKLEVLASEDSNANSREVSISFGKVEKDVASKKTLILKQPSKNIPQIVEELYGINLVLQLKDGNTRDLPFDSASIHSFTLRVKLMHADQLDNINLSDVVSASINAKSPVFLLQELQKEFDNLKCAKDYNMQKNLCENIKFIFGPPGTGKTTYLVKDILQPLVAENEKVKILVLTPTNKAADVIVNRFKESLPNNDYENWLVRFGVTNDESIEASKIFFGRNLNIENRKKTVLVTTIARLPYDSFVSENNKSNQSLKDVKWDYIVVDEASMIPLIQMVYLLYSQKPQKFIIAGDPFQIEPTVAVNTWKEENIYKMVKLKSFDNPSTFPHPYEVICLKKQYRSIPSVGEIFSQLTYNGILEHNRSESDCRPLNIKSYLDYKNLNLVKFPMVKYESIYKSKYLGKSSYQIYSAIFAYEFAKYIAQSIAKKNPTESFKIGIISPYGAQAKLINNLLLTEKWPDNISILCGTIHGFQGDECDVLLTVFNPPQGISASDKMFLNHKNIINVAISRARDYLFVLMPDENTDKIENLKLVNKVEELMRRNINCKVINSHEIEKLIFINEHYLEENIFSTGHQSVNVYGMPEKKYEVRSEDDAIDIQVHKNVSNAN